MSNVIQAVVRWRGLLCVQGFNVTVSGTETWPASAGVSTQVILPTIQPTLMLAAVQNTAGHASSAE